MLDPIVQPLRREDFAELMSETFRAANSTIISVIQGVALGILATKVYDTFFSVEGSYAVLSRYWPHALVHLVAIIIVT
jgi:hypothetical protein